MTSSVTSTVNSATQKILVLGATGPTGRYIVSQAVNRGYDVTILVRAPEKAAGHGRKARCRGCPR
jgi:uncharacterized protein YbjT (DUF2867 family)